MEEHEKNQNRNQKPGDSPALKRQKTSHEESQNTRIGTSNNNSTGLQSLNRSITPPPSRRASRQGQGQDHDEPKNDVPQQEGGRTRTRCIPSPIQLTHIRDIPDSTGYNRGTVKLRDILGDPMIKECWQFNFLFDVDFLMDHFDADVRSMVQVKVVHGSWKKEAPNRIRIEEACNRHQNVQQIIAYMPEPFGSHHSKMMILIRHDDQVQIVIHTANMIPQDWRNMCQAVWRSPLLPLSKTKGKSSSNPDTSVGSGSRFKRDLLTYLEAYRKKEIGTLIDELKKYDFGAIRATLIASIPSRQEARSLNSGDETIWGWPALKDALRNIPISRDPSRKRKPHIVLQVSSVATLGQNDKYLKETFFDSLAPLSDTDKSGNTQTPKFSIIFPTPDEVRRTIDGYEAGGSIHMKLQSAAQQKQLAYLRNYLCHWAGDTGDTANKSSVSASTSSKTHEAGRKRAAPHIKTYIRFSDRDMTSIDWAMVTSSNLSTQAWGAAINSKGEVRICSWEVGVLVWPDLFVDDQNDSGEAQGKNIAQYSRMVPCFRRDLPSEEQIAEVESDNNSSDSEALSTLVGFRMPYNLPLTPYNPQDVPWSPAASYSEPDCRGRKWE